MSGRSKGKQEAKKYPIGWPRSQAGRSSPTLRRFLAGPSSKASLSLSISMGPPVSESPPMTLAAGVNGGSKEEAGLFTPEEACGTKLWALGPGSSLSENEGDGTGGTANGDSAG